MKSLSYCHIITHLFTYNVICILKSIQLVLSNPWREFNINYTWTVKGFQMTDGIMVILIKSLLTGTKLELDLDFHPMDLLLWQVFGKSDFFASGILIRKILWMILLLLKSLYYDDNSQNCISLCKANKRSIYLSIYLYTWILVWSGLINLRIKLIS